MPAIARTVGIVAVLAAVVACGDTPLGEVGERSSDWLTEPTVVTTTTVPVTVPIVVQGQSLVWFNESIVSESMDDPAALQAEVFDRRGGDLFIQASKAEISTLIPDLLFPASAPHQAEYVTSQLVFESSGELSDEPTAAFGIWSAEPYTRSRSVAQIAVLDVSTDPEAASEVMEAGTGLSCARFSDRTTQTCELTEIDSRPVWILEADIGTTLVWFDTVYRYELFGRVFVSRDALEEMVGNLVLLNDLETAGG